MLGIDVKGDRQGEMDSMQKVERESECVIEREIEKERETERGNIR